MGSRAMRGFERAFVIWAIVYLAVYVPVFFILGTSVHQVDRETGSYLFF